MFAALVFAVSLAAAAIASVTGFGIGSLLTPTFGLRVATNVAVAAVSVPHLAGTALRFWLMRSEVDRRVVVSFGLTSAAGGLTGALLQRWAGHTRLTIVFGSVLLFVAASELTGLSRRMRFHGAAAWIAGALSGVLAVPPNVFDDFVKNDQLEAVAVAERAVEAIRRSMSWRLTAPAPSLTTTFTCLQAFNRPAPTTAWT